MSERLFVGASRVDALPPHARGMAYGDGVFETMRVHRGAVPWFDRHWQRLLAGATRLRLRVPDRAQVQAELDALASGKADAALKLIVSRGGDRRGYAPDADALPVWLLSAHAPPLASGGLSVRWCRTRLATQPALAGIKHCNRLEQVLARGEWQGAEFDEGLMCDIDGLPVCATAANLFVWRQGRWLTPPVDRCGVAGVCRGWALDALDARVASLTVAQVETADAVFLCNALRGILPVARLGLRAWPRHRALSAAMRCLAAAHPAFPPKLEQS